MSRTCAKRLALPIFAATRCPPTLMPPRRTCSSQRRRLTLVHLTRGSPRPLNSPGLVVASSRRRDSLPQRRRRLRGEPGQPRAQRSCRGQRPARDYVHHGGGDRWPQACPHRSALPPLPPTRWGLAGLVAVLLSEPAWGQRRPHRLRAAHLRVLVAVGLMLVTGLARFCSVGRRRESASFSSRRPSRLGAAREAVALRASPPAERRGRGRRP